MAGTPKRLDRLSGGKYRAGHVVRHRAGDLAKTVGTRWGSIDRMHELAGNSMTNIPLSARLPITQRAILAVFTISIGLVTPSLTLLAIQMIVGSVPFETAFADILFKQFAAGHNLFMIAEFGLIPFILLAIMMLRFPRHNTRRKYYTRYVSGLIGILGFMIPAHVGIWYPLYGPGGMSSTAVLGFFVIPFYCIGTLILGMLIGRLVTRAKWFRAHPVGHCQKCGYDLTGNVSGVCSECGNSIRLSSVQNP